MMGSRLTTDLKKALQCFKKGMRAQSSKQKIADEGWLTDNYFFLEQACAAALAESVRSKPDADALYDKCRQVCKSGVLPSQRELIENFENSGVYYADKLSLALRASLLVYAGEGVKIKGIEGKELLSNSVRSLRRLEEFDFEYITGAILSCEKLLQSDPAGIYGLLDDFSKSEYRKLVMTKAEASGKSEAEAAEEALINARKSGKHIG